MTFSGYVGFCGPQSFGMFPLGKSLVARTAEGGAAQVVFVSKPAGYLSFRYYGPLGLLFFSSFEEIHSRFNQNMFDHTWPGTDLRLLVKPCRMPFSNFPGMLYVKLGCVGMTKALEERTRFAVAF